jgi:uncharacterized protein (DUF302 family)
MTKAKTDYAFRVRLDLPYAQAVENVSEALKEEGFGVLTEIDVKATLKEKLDIDFRKYVILGACNPHLAHEALSEDLDVGLLLPCNVIVFEDDGNVEVAVVEPRTLLGVIENPGLNKVAVEARERLQRVFRSLR